MDLRESKYTDHETMSRVKRNEKIYDEIKDMDIDNYNVRSNAVVLGNQENEIDVEKIKKILDTKYNQVPKRKSIRLEEDEDKGEEVKEEKEITKEYNINSILAKAKDKKHETYEDVRAKKLRDTQFDILNNLDLDNADKPEEDEESTDEGIMELINTISINEKKIKEQNNVTLDDLENLSQDDNKDDCQDLKNEIEKIEKTSKILNNKEENLDNSFYETKDLFQENDFEDNDFVEEKKLGLGVKILIIVLVIAFIIGLLMFLKSYLSIK